MDWHKNQDLGVREFRLATGGAPRAFPKREAGPNQDAPFAIPYPSYTRTHTEIVLPGGGKGFTVRGPNGAVHVAGHEIVSDTAIQGDLASFTVDQHAMTSEIAHADAEAANREIRKLRDIDSFVRAPPEASTDGQAAK
jgi:hypothetical protein